MTVFRRFVSVWLLLTLMACTVETPAVQPPSSNPAEPNQHMLLGNPSNANENPDNFLIVRDQYVLAYNRTNAIANWTSWHLELADLGPAERSEFMPDPTLPEGWYRVVPTDYSRSGYDRGHLVPSADRTASAEINQTVFYMSNIIPQAPDNNQGPWNDLEEYSRKLVRDGNELYIIAGPAGNLGSLAGGKITIPASVWKIIVVLPAGADDISRISAATEVIAVNMPNTQGLRGTVWRDYVVSVADIEQLTNYDFLSVLAMDVQTQLQGGAGAPAIEQPPTAPTAAPTSVDCSELFFSEYIEGSGNNKVIEIYNPTPSPINLSGYRIELYANGSPSATGSFELNGTLEAGMVYVIANSQAVPEMLERATTTSGIANFNGNDALVLLHNNQIIDSIGQIGVDPGERWGNPPFTTQDYTLRRKPEILHGRTATNEPFDPAIEWDAHPTDAADGLFGHISMCE